MSNEIVVPVSIVHSGRFDAFAKRRSQGEFKNKSFLELALAHNGTMYVRGRFNGWSFENSWVPLENAGFSLSWKELKAIFKYFKQYES